MGELAPFADLGNVWCLVRVVDPPAAPLLRGPFAEADDRALLQTHAIDLLVTKHAGGDATVGKIVAARKLGIPVLMVRRPPPEPGDTVPPDGAVAWVKEKLRI